MSFLSTGIDTRTGSIVQVQRPANFDDAVNKLGLKHALGSLRVMQLTSPSVVTSDENVDVSNLPTDTQDSSSASGQDAQKDDSSDWVPLQLQLGLPLAPAELCDLVCR